MASVSIRDGLKQVEADQGLVDVHLQMPAGAGGMATAASSPIT